MGKCLITGKVRIHCLFYLKLAFFYELCDRMRFEVNCAKSHHCVISDGLFLECSTLIFRSNLKWHIIIMERVASSFRGHFITFYYYSSVSDDQKVTRTLITHAIVVRVMYNHWLEVVGIKWGWVQCVRARVRRYCYISSEICILSSHHGQAEFS